MNIKRAGQLRNAFGPNTVVYETYTLEQIVNEFVNGDYAGHTENDWAHIQLRAESVIAERGGYYREWVERMEPSVLERLSEIGVNPEDNTY